jgi:hypothetical protein
VRWDFDGSLSKDGFAIIEGAHLMSLMLSGISQLVSVQKVNSQHPLYLTYKQ